MRAVVCDRYGPPGVLRLDEVAKPVSEPDEVLIRVRATTVNRTDCGVRAGEPLISRLVCGLRRPRWRILGTELARKPAAVSFDEAAAVCDGAILALGCLRPADVRKGQSVLIYGASGSIGTAAVQLASYFEAAGCPATCRRSTGGRKSGEARTRVDRGQRRAVANSYAYVPDCMLLTDGVRLSANSSVDVG